MESLESKLERLSPDQLKEAEDFVDFLLLRSGNSPYIQVPPLQVPSMVGVAPPVLTCPEPEHPSLASTSELKETGDPGDNPAPAGPGDWITRDYMDYGQFEQQPPPTTEVIKKVKAKNVQHGEPEKSRQLLDWID
jgi:hypothetical protein